MEHNILIFILLGFIAEIIDGALGMAYGVSCTTFLLSVGVSAPLASASVHFAEMFTTLTSGLSHLKFGNVDRNLFKRLLVPGMIGGIIGAYILSVSAGQAIKLFVTIYLMLTGLYILYKVIKKHTEVTNELSAKKTILLGWIGGFFDAIGGGGWGPIVTSTLVARGYEPRFSVGSVNLAEFFVTVAESITFILFIRITNWQVILGLIIGGMIAAPFAAFLCKRVPKKVLMALVGVLIFILSLRTIILMF